MKTSVIAHRSLQRGTLEILATLSLLALALAAPARADVRVAAQVGPVAVDYRDAGPGYDARARVTLEPLAARVLIGRPDCGPERGTCAVTVVEPCGRHDRDRDGFCDKCERRERRHDRCDYRDDRRDYRDERHACGDGRGGYDEIGGLRVETRFRGRCEHTDRCDACRPLEIGTCRAHRGLMWVAGHYEAARGRHGRVRSVWVPAHWEQPEVAYR